MLHAGSAEYDNVRNAYTVSGSGENMWFGIDDFHFVWKKMSGDVAISANINFVGDKRKQPSQGRPDDSPVARWRLAAVDVARHGDGLTSLQFRDAPGANTHEVESNVSAPQTVRIEKRGDYFYAFVSGKDGKLEPAGASTKLALNGDFYIGIGVCAHDKDDVEKAVFSNVESCSCFRPATARLSSKHTRDGTDRFGRPPGGICGARAL